MYQKCSFGKERNLSYRDSATAGFHHQSRDQNEQKNVISSKIIAVKSTKPRLVKKNHLFLIYSYEFDVKRRLNDYNNIITCSTVLANNIWTHLILIYFAFMINIFKTKIKLKNGVKS